MSLCMQICYAVSSTNEGPTIESLDQHEGTNSMELISSEPKFRQFLFGEEALKISPTEPYCLRRPIRRGHLNISLHYPMQQVHETFYFFSYASEKDSQ